MARSSLARQPAVACVLLALVLFGAQEAAAQGNCILTLLFGGCVRDNVTQQPLPGREVCIEGYEGRACAITDDAGCFKSQLSLRASATEDSITFYGYSHCVLVSSHCGAPWRLNCIMVDGYMRISCNLPPVIACDTSMVIDVPADGPPRTPSVTTAGILGAAVRPGDSLYVFEDGSGNAQSWNWLSTCGTMTGRGPRAIWHAPESIDGDVDTCYISVEVGNECGTTRSQEAARVFVVAREPGPGRMVITTDTLDFGIVLPGTTDTMSFPVYNTQEYSRLAITATPWTSIVSGSPSFVNVWNFYGEPANGHWYVVVSLSPVNSDLVETGMTIQSSDPLDPEHRLPVYANQNLAPFMCIMNRLLDPVQDCSLDTLWAQTQGNGNGLLDIGDLRVLLNLPPLANGLSQLSGSTEPEGGGTQ